MNDITIIGAGPAGMMAAITAARRGAGIVLLEQNTEERSFFQQETANVIIQTKKWTAAVLMAA